MCVCVCVCVSVCLCVRTRACICTLADPQVAETNNAVLAGAYVDLAEG